MSQNAILKISYFDQILHGMEKTARKNKKDDMTKIWTHNLAKLHRWQQDHYYHYVCEKISTLFFIGTMTLAMST